MLSRNCGGTDTCDLHNMRTTTISVHNNQAIEVFTQRKEEGFELWMVGTIKGNRMVLDHHLTHDDLENRLRYQQPNDLEWREAVQSEIPSLKHSNAEEMEETINRGKFIDNESVVAQFGFGSIDLLPNDRKTLNAAKKAILGQWTDGQVKIVFNSESKLTLHGLCRDHLLNRVRNPNDPVRDWWSFASWQLWFMNAEQKIGQRIGVLRLDQEELHVFNDKPDCLAHVFRRLL